MSTGNTLSIFYAEASFPPATNYATLNLRSIPVLEFDTTTQETAYFKLLMPRLYAGGGLTVYLSWMAATATSGTIGWDVSFSRLNDNNQDVDSIAYATAQTVTAATVNGTSGKITTTNVAVTSGANMDNVGGGEFFILRIRRDVANDTATGDAQLIGGEIKET